MGLRRKNAVLMTLRHVFAWRSTVWWRNTTAMNMRVDPGNVTRWKPKWGWHNRGCVWGNMASEWSGEEERCSQRRRCQDERDKRDFVTFALDSVKHSVAYSAKNW